MNRTNKRLRAAKERLRQQLPQLKWPQGQFLKFWLCDRFIYFYVARHCAAGYKCKPLYPTKRLHFTQKEIDLAKPIDKEEYQNYLIGLL